MINNKLVAEKLKVLIDNILVNNILVITDDFILENIVNNTFEIAFKILRDSGITNINNIKIRIGEEIFSDINVNINIKEYDILVKYNLLLEERNK